MITAQQVITATR